MKILKQGMLCSLAIFLTIRFFFVLIFISLLIPSPAVSANSENTPSRFQFQVAPRVWLSLSDDAGDEEADTQLLPLLGGTLTLSHIQSPRFSFLATGLFGSSSLNEPNRKTRRERTDLELLIRYTFSTNVSAFLGVRHIPFDEKIRQILNAGTSTQGSIDSRFKNKLSFAEFGLGYFSDIKDSHRVFGNFLLAVGQRRGKSHVVRQEITGTTVTNTKDTNLLVGVDVNLGYQYWITPWANVSGRYRIFIFVAETGNDVVKSFPFHGPEFSFGFVF